MTKLLREFRDFAMRGNVVDLAVGLIIGAAFGVIVTSLVKDVLMPPLGYAIGKVDFNDLAVTLKDAEKDATGKEVRAAVVIGYGKFINATIQFVIQALAVFLVVKAMNTLKRKPPAPAGPPPPPPPDVQLLSEIRDLLKARG